MKIWLSGGYQQALLKNNDDYYLLKIKPEENITPIDSIKISSITKDWQDVYSLEVESNEIAFLELHRAVLCYDAMLLASLAIDRNVSLARRKQAAIEAEKLFKQDFTKTYVLQVYSAYPMPESADFITIKKFCLEDTLREFVDLIETIENYNEQISAARNSWDNINDNFFDGLTNRSVIQAQVIREGLFLSMVMRIGNVKRCEKLLEVAAKTALIHIPVFEEVLWQWINEAKNYSVNNHTPLPLFSNLDNLPLIDVNAVQVSAGVGAVKSAFEYA